MTDCSKSIKSNLKIKIEVEINKSVETVKCNRKSEESCVLPPHQIFFVERHYDDHELDIKKEKNIITTSKNNQRTVVRNLDFLNDKKKAICRSNSIGIVTLDKPPPQVAPKRKNETVCEEGGVVILTKYRPTNKLVEYNETQRTVDPLKFTHKIRIKQEKPLETSKVQLKKQIEFQKVYSECVKQLDPQKVKVSRTQAEGQQKQIKKPMNLVKCQKAHRQLTSQVQVRPIILPKCRKAHNEQQKLVKNQIKTIMITSSPADQIFSHSIFDI